MKEKMKSELEEMNHKATIDGMEMMIQLMIKFGDKFDLNMAVFTVKDYKKHFNIS